MLRAFLLIVVLSAIASIAGPLSADEGTDFFESRIRPVLVKHCYQCHSAESASLKGGLMLDSRDGARKGGDSGPAVVPGDLDQSLILEAIRYESFEMPPKGKLPDEVIADFVKWIELGAPDPRDASDVVINEVPPADIDWEQARRHWAFQRPIRHAPPDVEHAEWARRPIDLFVLAKLDAAGLDPSGDADPRTLIRRVTFDLIGLPPTPEQVEAFVNDSSPRAYEDLIERLLASPAYGERWARMWLDVARYAEDQAHIVGDNRELCYPNAYMYRDWVIASLNADMPYDEFIRHQLADDLMAPDDRTQRAALGFVGLGPKYYRRNSPEVMADEWEDRVDLVSRGLLGLTVACARCHHHKYDPLTTEDYYAIAGVFASTEMFNRPLKEDVEKKEDGEAKDPEQALHIIRDGDPHDMHVLIRGDVGNLGPLVPRRFLQILCEGDPRTFSQGSGRLELAEAIVDPGNPLTARVIVNRIWAQHFGRPLVTTTSNFGTLGDKPTHPELLDDLAVRFMDNGWSLKWLHREMVLSSAYRQSSQADPAKIAADPENRLLARANRRRLDVETWRDALLCITGEIDPAVGGKSINPADLGQTRRTVYAEISRLEVNKFLALFDFPDPNTHSPGRVRTTTPLQKLYVLNSPQMVHYATALTERIDREVGEDAAARIDRAYQLAFGRLPTSDELRLAEEYLGPHPDKGRWITYVHALLAANELFFID